MKTVDNIVKRTLVNLTNKGIRATPNEYHKEFCKVARNVKFTVKECEQFKELVSRLSISEKEEIKKNNIETIEDMIPILLNRVATKNIDTLASLFQKSLTPSISLEIDESLKKFSVKIGNSPSLMFEEDIQHEMQEFINKRFEADEKIVKQKTADIAKLVTLMGQYLNDAIESSGNGGEEVSNIKDKIEAFDVGNSSIQELSKLQSQLINAASSIENEMSNVSKRMQDGKSQVTDLQNKIKQLEQELGEARKEIKIDHLTGVLTRRAYDKEAERVEAEYNRLGQNYAIVFFDIDYFKDVNDTYGHEGGDIILSTFAKILQKETREIDILGRYGGEEFVAIIHYNLKKELLKYLQRVKSIVTQNKFVYQSHKIKITFSAGVAIRDSHNTYNDAIQQADILLYKAKESGRNKIILEDGTTL